MANVASCKAMPERLRIGHLPMRRFGFGRTVIATKSKCGRAQKRPARPFLMRSPTPPPPHKGVSRMAFSKLPPDEIERRRILSVAVWKVRKDAAWQKRYQEMCDKFYWKHGRCCAGCDHWASDAGHIGECLSAPPVSGEQVLRSLGIDWCTLLPPPGQPHTKRDHVCGAFKDDFDWPSLGAEYLARIGATPTQGSE